MVTRRQFLATASAIAAVPALADRPEAEVRFAAGIVRRDVDLIWSTLLAVSPDPFFTSTRSHVEDVFRAARAAITAPLTAREAWLTIAPALGALNDGHVGLGFPGPLNAAPRRFPLRFALGDDDALLVAADRTGTIPLGSRIVGIDGITAERYRDVTLAAFGAQTRTLHRARVTGSGAWTAIALFGTGPAYGVRWISPAGVPGEGTVTVARRAGTAATTALAGEPYSFRTLQRGTVGLLDYRRCEDLPRFRGFLRTTFRAMKRSAVRALIIDIRANGGGDSELNDALWPYVSGKPFKQFGGALEKACDRLKREYGREQYVQAYGDAAWQAADGTILRTGTDPNAGLIIPKPNALRFAGPVYLLTSSLTFSSGMSCALAAKDYGLATIVGEETGEPASTTGEVYTMITPGVGFRAYLTTKVFFPPKLQPGGRGVIPDVVVPTTLQDRAAGRDPVLERVLATIDASTPRCK